MSKKKTNNISIKQNFVVVKKKVMVREDSTMSDDVFEDEANNISRFGGGLTPASQEQLLLLDTPDERYYQHHPSPTGYRDYKPPAEVLNDNFGGFSDSSNFRNDPPTTRKAKFPKESHQDDEVTHKVCFYSELLLFNLNLKK